MIIKIKDINNGSWWLYDNLERVHFEYGYSSSRFELKVTAARGNENGSQIDDFEIYENKSSLVHPFLSVIDTNRIVGSPCPISWIIARDLNNNENLFVFNTEAYILNDNGKTIERIPEYHPVNSINK